jgi:hypothetical protein
MTPDFTTIRRFVAWFSIAVLGVASWLPAEEMIRTGADGRLEHAAAYLISGLAVFTAYPRRLKWLIAILMMCYAGILEFGQLWVPGRHAGILDWAASSGGVLCALFLYDAYQRVYATDERAAGSTAPNQCLDADQCLSGADQCGSECTTPHQPNMMAGRHWLTHWATS